METRRPKKPRALPQLTLPPHPSPAFAEPAQRRTRLRFPLRQVPIAAPARHQRIKSQFAWSSRIRESYHRLSPVPHSHPAPAVPLAYRVEKLYATLGNRGEHEQTNRPGSRHSGSVTSKNSRARTTQRLRRQPAPQTSFRRHPPSQRRLPLPPPPQTRAGRLDHRRKEAQRKYSPRKVTFHNASRQKASQKRSRKLEPPRRRYFTRRETQ